MSKIKREKTCQSEYLYCHICDNVGSACCGDYWNLDKDFEFLCQDCQSLLWLCQKGSRFGGDEVILKKVKVKDLLDIV